MSVEILSTAAQLYEHVGMWELSIMMSVSVCLSVTVRKLYGTICPIFTIFVHDCGSVFLWRRCDALRTSGFKDDVISQVMGHVRHIN